LLYNVVRLINSSLINDLIVTLNNDEHILIIDHTIQSYSIFEALGDGSRLSEIVQEFADHIEKHIVVKTLEFTDGNKSMAARILKINYKTL
jgi:DNA-binding protein Fis